MRRLTVNSLAGRLTIGPRRGVMVVVVLALLVVATTLFGVWTTSALRQQQQLRQREFAIQSRRLAEAGIERAAARIGADPSYAGETWNVSAEQLDGRHAARVEIATELSASGSADVVRATAVHPAEGPYRVRHTEQASVPRNGAADEQEPINNSSNSGDEP